MADQIVGKLADKMAGNMVGKMAGKLLGKMAGKIEGNMARDEKQRAALLDAGWRIATLWECAMKGRTRLPFPEVVEACVMWLNSDKRLLEIEGDETRATR